MSQRGVLAIDGVADPVQAVLNGPMGATGKGDGRKIAFDSVRPAGDVPGDGVRGPAVLVLSGAIDADGCGGSGPRRFAGSCADATDRDQAGVAGLVASVAKFLGGVGDDRFPGELLERVEE